MTSTSEFRIWHALLKLPNLGHANSSPPRWLSRNHMANGYMMSDLAEAYGLANNAQSTASTI
jgi:hypothetical protein